MVLETNAFSTKKRSYSRKVSHIVYGSGFAVRSFCVFALLFWAVFLGVHRALVDGVMSFR